MAQLPGGQSTGTRLLSELATDPSCPRLLANLLGRQGAAVDAALVWIAANLDAAIHIIKGRRDHVEVLARLRAKLVEDFIAGFAEVRCAAQLARANLPVDLEPTFPASGPDARTKAEEQEVDIEVTSLATDAHAQWRDRLMEEVRNCLRKGARSEFQNLHVSLWEHSEYPRDSKALKHLVSAVRRIAVGCADRKHRLPSTLYLSRREAVVAEGFHFLHSERPRNDPTHPSHRAGQFAFVVTFEDFRSSGGPIISIGGGLEGESPRRYQKKVDRKRDQLPKDRPAVVFLDVSTDGHDGLDGFGVDTALLGEMAATISVDSDGREAAVPFRKPNGLFEKTGRISAVVTTGWGFIFDERQFEFRLVTYGRTFVNPNARHPAPSAVLTALASSLPTDIASS